LNNIAKNRKGFSGIPSEKSISGLMLMRALKNTGSATGKRGTTCRAYIKLGNSLAKQLLSQRGSISFLIFRGMDGKRKSTDSRKMSRTTKRWDCFKGAVLLYDKK